MSTQSEPTPLLVLGEARRRSLATRLSAAVGSWWKEWSVAPDSGIEVELHRAMDDSAAMAIVAATRAAVASVAGVPQFLVLASDDGLARVVGLPRPAAFVDSEASALALEIAHELVRSLASTVASQAGLANVHIDVPANTAGVAGKIIHKRQWWVASIPCGSHRPALLLALSSQMIATLAPAPPPRLSEPERRRAAILDGVVRLQVVLGEVHLTVGDLASLSVNDVIVLQEDLSQAASLLTMDGQRVAKVAVGRVDNKRAVSLCR